MKYLFILIPMVLLTLSCNQGQKPTASAEATTQAAMSNARLTPSSIDPSKPLDGEMLLQAYNYWIGKEVIFTAFPNTFFEDDVLRDSFYIRAIATDDRRDASKALASVVLAKPDPKTYNGNTAILVKGKVKGRFDNKLEIVDAEVLAPQTAVGTNAIITEVYEETFGWIGKKVSVKGNYWGVTKSTTSYGDSWRIDILDAKGNKTIALSYDKDPGEPTKKEGLIIEGIISGLIFDTVELKDAVIR